MSNFIITYYYIKTAKINKQGLCSVYCRLTLNGERREFSTQQNIPSKLWDSTRQRLKGNSELTRTINFFIEGLNNKITKEFTELSLNGKGTLDSLVAKLTNKPSKFTLLNLFDIVLSEKERLVNKEVSQARINRYNVARRKLVAFCNYSFKKNDVALSELSKEFITKFETFLISDTCRRNTANTYLKILKTCSKTGFENGYLEHDLFQSYKCHFSKVRRGYLTEGEIKKLIDVQLPDPFLDITRDVFLFCTFTGLSYSDVYNLRKENFESGINGNEWLIVYRQKTEERSTIPLLEVPKSILKKYENHPNCVGTPMLLPVPPNQRMNQHLKIIAMHAGINQRLTTHLARHSFATTVALKNGMALYTVQKTLGHSSPKTTQIYAEMTAELIGSEMATLSDKISGTYKYPALNLGA